MANIDFSTSVDLDKAFEIIGNSLSKLGISVCGGDINNDGFSDVIIGAPGENSDIRAAYVLFYSKFLNCEEF